MFHNMINYHVLFYGMNQDQHTSVEEKCYLYTITTKMKGIATNSPWSTMKRV